MPNLYNSRELQLGFLPKKGKHFLRFSKHQPHPLARGQDLRARLWGKAGMYHCPGAASRGSGVAADGGSEVAADGVQVRIHMGAAKQEIGVWSEGG